MGFPVYDYRTDVRNILITPQIRSRFLRMEPGQTASIHSHDLGHEIFLVLEGKAEFQINGQTDVVGPGQMCVALADEIHSVRVVGDDPMTMYLSVTPHIQPTHTGRTEAGERLPHRFMPSSAYDVEADPTVPVETLIDRHVEAAHTLAADAQTCARTQQDMAAKLKDALSRGDENAAEDARKAMWETLYAVYKQVYDLADAWNDLAPRTTEF